MRIWDFPVSYFTKKTGKHLVGIWSYIDMFGYGEHIEWIKCVVRRETGEIVGYEIRLKNMMVCWNVGSDITVMKRFIYRNMKREHPEYIQNYKRNRNLKRILSD